MALQDKTLRVWQDEVVLVSRQWAAEAEKRGTTVSSSTWAFSGSGSLASASLSGTLATVKLTATGDGVLSDTVVLANGETLVAKREVIVSE